jgi:hypothetical protein
MPPHSAQVFRFLMGKKTSQHSWFFEVIIKLFPSCHLQLTANEWYYNWLKVKWHEYFPIVC